ncbi:MAG TPA: hypothetical protein P5550_11665 [Bacteroidales bacterium]|nr:hypothetical protein [Bacteroidales bacterium]HRZ76414.1 hypothetical protein [Bacteroidales bacterium]
MQRNLTPKSFKPFTDRTPRSGKPAAGSNGISPAPQVIANLLNYSRALTVERTQVAGTLSYILN